MNTEKLVRMANEIMAFFRPYSEEEAQAGVRDHLVKFWTRGMRSALLTRLRVFAGAATIYSCKRHVYQIPNCGERP